MKYVGKTVEQVTQEAGRPSFELVFGPLGSSFIQLPFYLHWWDVATY